MIRITKNPTVEQVAAFQSFSDKHWGPEVDEEGAKNDFFDFPRIIVERSEDDVLVSGLFVHLKHAIIQDQVIHIAGIGGVVTHTDYRHKGYATEVLAACIEDLKKMQLDIVLLCTDIPKLGSLYSRVGFIPFPKGYSFVNKLKELKMDTDAMILPLNDNVFQLINSSNEELFVGLSNF